MLDSLEQSALGTWVASSTAGYYIMLAFHAVGLSMIVGVMMVIDLRILGVVRGISAPAQPRLVTLGWWGFWINALSGIALFFSEANKMFYDNTFRWKLFLIFVGVISTYVMNRTILKPAANGDVGRLISSSAKAQAIFSLLLWLAVITVGRMIAYLAPPGA